MDQAFLASFLIGLREGLEATLVVSILVAYLVKSGRRRELLPLWGGVAVAVALSVIFGGLLTYTETSLLADYRSRELFEAVASVLAVVLVTWMIFWMRRTARRLKGELTGRLETAVGAGALAVAGIAFVSVIREGLETALLFYAAAQGASSTATPLVAISLGVLTAILLGAGLYAGAIRVNLQRFFTVSGVLLVFVAAGILKYGIHDFQEAGVLPGLDVIAFDISGVLDPGSWYGAALAGMFNITAAPTVLETIAYVVYLVPVLVLFLWPARTPAAPRGGAAPGSSSATTPTNSETSPHVPA
ncbi:FTR1 family protein [Blastococcus sp. TML/M2B]|uniref:iron uptake transporter permease EfeU n=1 Tax=unclassified Blastococcus TaxID=2619396 RepID=UPI00190A4028|nr:MULTISPECIES: iron uptake transporter permease EfeU [unclassified Blastococcus]MBN1094428.1 FTR1 family protein [Blastococcus sp. TML/M2B]MBN1095388.1 FTR1 family protein [Blastococcus sp. TML/C7B]